MAFGLDIWQGELDLAINTTWSDERWVEGFDSVCCHDYFDVAACVETVELIEEFQHSSLNFALSTGCRLVSAVDQQVFVGR